MQRLTQKNILCNKVISIYNPTLKSRTTIGGKPDEKTR
jgi:hypothetical protein